MVCRGVRRARRIGKGDSRRRRRHLVPGQGRSRRCALIFPDRDMNDRLAIATPVEGGEMWSAPVTLGWHRLMSALVHGLGAEMVPAEITFSVDVVRARNRLAGHVLRETTATHVLWLDSDTFTDNPMEGVQIVRDMLASGADVVAATYVSKRHPLRLVHQPLASNPAPDRGLLTVKGVGFGFTLTSRACLERLSKAERIYTDHPRPHRIANIFGQLIDEDDCLLGEGFAFWRLWRARGG